MHSRLSNLAQKYVSSFRLLLKNVDAPQLNIFYYSLGRLCFLCAVRSAGFGILLRWHMRANFTPGWPITVLQRSTERERRKKPKMDVFVLPVRKQERDPFTDLRRLLQSSDLTLTGMLSDLD